MRPSRSPRHSAAKRCEATKALRHRMHAAEAALREAQSDTARARAALAEERRAIRAERVALVAWAESPLWERDLLVLARDRVRRAIMAATMERRNCSSCGGLGAGLYQGFLCEEIGALEAEHGLEPAPVQLPDGWAAALGGREGRDAGWLRRGAREDAGRGDEDYRGGPRVTFL